MKVLALKTDYPPAAQQGIDMLHRLALHNDVVDVLLIFGTQNDFFDACPLRREDFFFDPTHWKHLAPQGDFSTHRDILSDLSLRWLFSYLLFCFL